ncbi:MAG: hypothetical protein AAF206_30835, partial [Bacteroidota bacterium]
DPVSQSLRPEPKGEVDLVRLEKLLNENIDAFEAELINDRTQYGIQFVARDDTTDNFLMYPEAEVNPAMGGMIAHPSRKIYWNEDIYFYTSSLPREESEPEFFSFRLKVGDTTEVAGRRLILEGIINLTNRDDLADYDVAAAARLWIEEEQLRYQANPIYTIEGRKPGMIADRIDELGMDFAFVDIDPQKGEALIQVRSQDPTGDYVILKAIRKPFINLLWLGTFILTAGFLISIYRRILEGRTRRK